MNFNEINGFVERYVLRYKTKTALLLTGEWGSGKSYYVSNELCPYLKGKKIRCITLSLYGISELSELSKQIYFQLRFPTFYKKTLGNEIASILGCNIISNLFSVKGLSFSVSEKQLMKLYEYVNLKNVLLIFEDFERSSIDIIQLLGFINGLVEYDDAKVLLVANEKELLGVDNKASNLETISSITTLNNAGNTTDSKDDFLLIYQRIKEKTIGDTIRFYPDFQCSIKNIISNYTGHWVDTLLQSTEINRIAGIVISRCNRNLRVLIYALQKAEDIFTTVPSRCTFDDTFYQASFEGLLILSTRIVSSDIPQWEGTTNISTILGSPDSPVFRFVYEFLRWNEIDTEKVSAAAEEYEKYRYFEKNTTREIDEDLYVLSNYHVQKESDVIDAIKNLEKKLNDPNYLGIYAYEKFAYCLICVSEVIAYDPESICAKLIRNAKKMCRDSEYSSQDVIWGVYSKETNSNYVNEKYTRFITELAKVIDMRDSLPLMSYDPKSIKSFMSESLSNKDRYILDHRFISRLNVNDLISMLHKSSAREIDDFREILFVFYRNSRPGEYDEEDKKSMDDFRKQLLIEKDQFADWDRIQKMQIEFLISNLEDFIKHF